MTKAKRPATSDVGQSIIRGLKQAIACAKGEKIGAKWYFIEPRDEQPDAKVRSRTMKTAAANTDS